MDFESCLRNRRPRSCGGLGPGPRRAAEALRVLVLALVLQGSSQTSLLDTVSYASALEDGPPWRVAPPKAIPVEVDGRQEDVNISLGDDPWQVAYAFCDSRGIGGHGQACANRLSRALTERLYCEEDAVKPKGVRTFRFLRADSLDNSKQFGPFRRFFSRSGFVECPESERMSGSEDAIWLLGHVTPAGVAEVFHRLNPHQTINTLPMPLHVGTKDALYDHLHRLSRELHEPPADFLIRSFDLPTLRHHYERRLSEGQAGLGLQGLWIVKDPKIEGGFGVQVMTGPELEEQYLVTAGSNGSRYDDESEHPMVQRYVHAPLRIHERKFSLGMFVVVLGADPFTVIVHDDTVTLLCSHAYTHDHHDLAAHLTNRARARLLDPDYDDDATLLHTEAFRVALEAEGVGWPAIRRQTRGIMSRAMLSILPTLRSDWFEHTTPRARQRLFALWRFDFLVDATGRAWLLELEIVPSTVGGGTPDVLLDDLWRVMGWGPVEEGEDEEMNRAEDYVRALLRESGDALQYDEAAVQAIARHEVRAARLGRFEFLYPPPPPPAGQQQQPHHRLLYERWAMPSDWALRRWLRLLQRREEEREEGGGGPRPNAEAAGEIRDQSCGAGDWQASTWVEQCRHCVEGGGGRHHTPPTTNRSSSDATAAAGTFYTRLADFRVVGPVGHGRALPSLDLAFHGGCCYGRADGTPSTCGGAGGDEAWLPFSDGVRVSSVQACEALGRQGEEEESAAAGCSFLLRAMAVSESNLIFGGGGEGAEEVADRFCDVIMAFGGEGAAGEGSAGREEAVEEEEREEGLLIQIVRGGQGCGESEEAMRRGLVRAREACIERALTRTMAPVLDGSSEPK